MAKLIRPLKVETGAILFLHLLNSAITKLALRKIDAAEVKGVALGR